MKACLDVAVKADQGLSYSGNHLDVTLALSREEVERVCKERGEGKRSRGEDRRNLYLAKEGGDVMYVCSLAGKGYVTRYGIARTFQLRCGLN